MWTLGLGITVTKDEIAHGAGNKTSLFDTPEDENRPRLETSVHE